MALKPLEIFKLLKKSNCGECGLPTCLAFAQAVASGETPARDCPHLTEEAARNIIARTEGPKPADGFAASIEALRDKVRAADLKAAAPKLGAKYRDGRLTLSILGREFHVHEDGGLSSQCHINSWISWLALTYASTPEPRLPEGRWVPFDELKSGRTTVGYFSRRCEEPLKVIADEHTEVFFELLSLFGAKDVEGFDADRAVELRPLPNVPMLVLYWGAEEDFSSRLRVMFDPTADSYLGPELITGMGRGMVEMFQKIIPRHEKGVLNLPYL